jgi:dTDP-4-dehydrorhamnose reductase
MKILLTGGSGMLGTEMKKYLKFDALPKSVMDITKPKTLKGNYDVVIHCAAYTNVPKAEIEKDKCFAINVTGTYNMVKAFPDAYFVYISTEHVYPKPLNFYCKTKLWGEEMVKAWHDRFLIIRTLFKKKPFDYEYAFFDQMTNGDYVDVITPMIVKEILKHNRGIINLGTGRKSMFELARRTKPDIKANSVDDIKNVRLAHDYI